MKKQIFFTVTNDLTYDQRMHRICESLAAAGYGVTLVGREMPSSTALQERPYRQRRLRCLFHKGFLFYAEYNLRLFFFLLAQRMDAVCAIDLDTILPCLFVSKLKGTRRVYDAHEYFTELKEVRTRPAVRKVWTAVERFAVPKFWAGYTVSEGLSQAFAAAYGCRYAAVRNLAVLRPLVPQPREKFLVFQGAVNEARGFEYLIPAMKKIAYPLVVCGDGNFMPAVKKLIAENGVQDKVELKGMLLPEELRAIAQKASLGLGFAEKEGINQFHALPNKFLDYLHAGLPQIAMNFPEYDRINRSYRVAVLVDELSADAIAEVVNATMENTALLTEMSRNALCAREELCWQKEEPKLLQFYAALFS